MLLADQFFIQNGHLFRLELPRSRRVSRIQTLNQRLYIPQKYREIIISAFHDRLGHASARKLYLSMSQRVFWQNLFPDVQQYTCDVCQRTKNKRKRVAPLHPLMPAERSFQTWHMDFKTLSRKTAEGNTAILCCVDNFTCFPIAIPTPDMSAITTAKVFVRDVVSIFGIPETVISDRGSNFTSQLFTELNKLLGVKQKISATFSARSNGKCESLVKQIGIEIKLYAKDDLTIEQVLPLILMGLRTSVNTQTNVSPYEAVFGSVMPLGSPVAMADDSTLPASMK